MEGFQPSDMNRYLTLDSYTGPYPRKELVCAQQTLYAEFYKSKSILLQRIQQKMKISPNHLSNTQEFKKRKLDVKDMLNQSQVKKLKTSSTKCFKCDFCEFICEERIGIQQHLQDQAHFSASCCSGNFSNGQLFAKFRINSMYIRNASALYQSLIAACPVCAEVFENIYACGMHYNIFHNRETYAYAVSPVVYNRTITISGNKCQECGEQFKKPKQLNSHWIKQKHLPYHIPSGNDFLFFKCPYCNKIFYNFLKIKLHMSTHRVHKLKHAINLYCFKRPKETLYLLPCSKVPAAEVQVKERIALLYLLRINLRKMNGSRSSIRLVTHELKQTVALLHKSQGKDKPTQ